MVLDGEALGLRPDGRPQPFQITMRRLGRQKDVATLRKEIPLSPYMFDALRFSDIQDSPGYPAGLALRFARVKRYRTDKTAVQADTIQTVTALFKTRRQ